MASPSPRRTVLLLLLCTALVTPCWASTAARQRPLPTKAPAAAPLSLLALSWSFLRSLWGEEGCGIDPSGRCATPKNDTGCGIDPDGRCATVAIRPPAPKIDEGCGIDPDGRCTH